MVSKSDIAIAHNLRQLVARLNRRLRKHISVLRLSVAEENVVRMLVQQQEVLPSEFCARLNLSSQFTSQVLNHLEELDFISRKPSKTDKRKVLVSLSKKGLMQVDNLRQEKEEWLASVISKQFSAEQKEIIKQAVELLASMPDI